MSKEKDISQLLLVSISLLISGTLAAFGTEFGEFSEKVDEFSPDIIGYILLALAAFPFVKSLLLRWKADSRDDNF